MLGQMANGSQVVKSKGLAYVELSIIKESFIYLMMSLAVWILKWPMLYLKTYNLFQNPS